MNLSIVYQQVRSVLSDILDILHVQEILLRGELFL